MAHPASRHRYPSCHISGSVEEKSVETHNDIVLKSSQLISAKYGQFISSEKLHRDTSSSLQIGLGFNGESPDAFKAIFLHVHPHCKSHRQYQSSLLVAVHANGTMALFPPSPSSPRGIEDKRDVRMAHVRSEHWKYPSITMLYAIVKRSGHIVGVLEGMTVHSQSIMDAQHDKPMHFVTNFTQQPIATLVDDAGWSGPGSGPTVEEITDEDTALHSPILNLLEQGREWFTGHESLTNITYLDARPFLSTYIASQGEIPMFVYMWWARRWAHHFPVHELQRMFLQLLDASLQIARTSAGSISQLSIPDQLELICDMATLIPRNCPYVSDTDEQGDQWILINRSPFKGLMGIDCEDGAAWAHGILRGMQVIPFTDPELVHLQNTLRKYTVLFCVGTLVTGTGGKEQEEEGQGDEESSKQHAYHAYNMILPRGLLGNPNDFDPSESSVVDGKRNNVVTIAETTAWTTSVHRPLEAVDERSWSQYERSRTVHEDFRSRIPPTTPLPIHKQPSAGKASIDEEYPHTILAGVPGPIGESAEEDFRLRAMHDWGLQGGGQLQFMEHHKIGIPPTHLIAGKQGSQNVQVERIMAMDQQQAEQVLQIVRSLPPAIMAPTVPTSATILQGIWNQVSDPDHDSKDDGDDEDDEDDEDDIHEYQLSPLETDVVRHDWVFVWEWRWLDVDPSLLVQVQQAAKEHHLFVRFVLVQVRSWETLRIFFYENEAENHDQDED